MPEAPAATESAARAARELATLVSRLRRRLRQVHGPADLTPSQTSLLSRLSTGGEISASELAEAEGVRPQSVAATLASLGERGLLERRGDPGDGRRQLLWLTDAGREVVEDRRRVGLEWLTRALDERYTEAERRQIIAALALLDRLTSP